MTRDKAQNAATTASAGTAGADGGAPGAAPTDAPKSIAMQQFIHYGRAMPTKRDADTRRRDFREIHTRFRPADAASQAGRCSQCGVPFCQIHCPLHNNIPDWLMLTTAGRLREAYDLSAATNNMPEICGAICPQDRLCEGDCVIEQSGHGTVTIGAVEKFLTETAWEEGWVAPLKPGAARGQSVGIIGAGPAGLAAAEQLRRRGYDVVIYDRHDRAGGLLIYGIPGFKLEKDKVLRRCRRLQDGGVVFQLDCEVGRDVSLAELRRRHDALLVATGVCKAREFAAPGSGLPGILPAMRYLTASNRKGLGDPVADFDSGELDAAGRNVIVVGGGDTAMDCVRTAIRQGAASVTCLYRRDRENMPGSRREVAHAEEEGVKFLWLTQPEAFLGDGALRAVRAVTMGLGAPDADGRRRPKPLPGSAREIAADMAIMALGYEAEDLPGHWQCPELTPTAVGTLACDADTGMTSLDGVFAAGDIVRGASLVVWAIRDGRDAAVAIERYLAAQTDTIDTMESVQAAE